VRLNRHDGHSVCELRKYFQRHQFVNEFCFQIVLASLCYLVKRETDSWASLNQAKEILDPYQLALQRNMGDFIKQHEQLKDVLIRLNPSDYIDWDEPSYLRDFDDSDSSSYS